MKKERNWSLAMVALVLRCYHQTSHSHALMLCSGDPAFAGLEMGGKEVADLVLCCGLACMSISVRGGGIPKSLQDFSNGRHVVLVGMQPSALTPYRHWGVLEASRNGSVAICLFGDSAEPLYTDQHIDAVITGEYVVIAQQIEEDDFSGIKAAMDG